MAKRYEVSDEACTVVAEPFTKNPRPGTGAPERPHDARWRAPGTLRRYCGWDMPERFGPWSTILRRYSVQHRMQPVIPMRSMKRKTRPVLARLFNRPKYRQRNNIERMFG